MAINFQHCRCDLTCSLTINISAQMMMISNNLKQDAFSLEMNSSNTGIKFEFFNVFYNNTIIFLYFIISVTTIFHGIFENLSTIN